MTDLVWDEGDQAQLDQQLGFTQPAVAANESSATLSTYPASVGPIGRVIRRLIGRNLHSGSVGQLRTLNEYRYDLPVGMRPPEARRPAQRGSRGRSGGRPDNRYGYLHETERVFAAVRAIRGIAEILHEVQEVGHNRSAANRRRQEEHPDRAYANPTVTAPTNQDLRSCARNLQHQVARKPSGNLLNPLPTTHPSYKADVDAQARSVLGTIRRGVSKEAVSMFVRECIARSMKPYCCFVLEILTRAVKQALLEVEKSWNAPDVTTYTQATLNNEDNVLTAAVGGFQELGTSLNEAGLVALELYGVRMLGQLGSDSRDTTGTAEAMLRHLRRFTSLEEETMRSIDALRRAPHEPAARAVRADVEAAFRARIRTEASQHIRENIEDMAHNAALDGTLLIISYIELIHALSAEPTLHGSRAEAVRAQLELGLSVVEAATDTIALFNAIGEVVTIPRGSMTVLRIVAGAAEVVGKAVSFVTAVFSIIDGYTTLSQGWEDRDELMVAQGGLEIAAGCCAVIGVFVAIPGVQAVAIVATLLALGIELHRLDAHAREPGAKKVMLALIGELSGAISSDCDQSTLDLLGATAQLNSLKNLVDNDDSIAWDLHPYLFIDPHDANSRTPAAQARHATLHRRLRKLQLAEAHCWLILGYHDPNRGNDAPPGEYERDPQPRSR